ncbi:MAG: Cobalamin import ATP-binding protein BtuD [Methanomassiliicoccales archaeon PtaU1.Bin030]|nr:MAG: Cobalamin import ATP-binding protein BtuD [Methanomassiliicoccales archaeon PtaU1.Bin030]
MQCEETMVKVEKISFGYNSKKALKGIELEAGKGEFIGLMGPNGSGKTTLMRCINRLLTIQEGLIFLADHELKTLNMMDIAKLCTTIPASIPDDFSLKVRDFVALGRTPYVTNWWWEGDEDEKIVDEALEEFKVSDFSGRRLNELSTGEKARVLLAKGVVQRPKIMLVDEPSAHLDLKYQLQVMESLRSLSRKGITVITASHDINLLTKYCDKVILLSKGEIVDYGSPHDVVNEKAMQEVYGVDVSLVTKGDTIFVLPMKPSEPPTDAEIVKTGQRGMLA